MEPIQRHTDKMTGKLKKKQTKPQKQMKTIRGTIVIEIIIIIIIIIKQWQMKLIIITKPQYRVGVFI